MVNGDDFPVRDEPVVGSEGGLIEGFSIVIVFYSSERHQSRCNWPPRFNAEQTRKLNFLNINFREALLTGKLMLTIET